MSPIKVRCVGRPNHFGSMEVPPCGWLAEGERTLPTSADRCPICDGLVEVVPATTPTAVAGPPPDLQQAIHAATPDWDAAAPLRPRPLHERVPWRIGVLDKDLFESPRDVETHALLIADWYVHDCAELLEQLQAAQAENQQLTSRNAELADVLNQLLGHIGMPFPVAGRSETVTAKIRQALIDRAHAALEQHAALGQDDQ